VALVPRVQKKLSLFTIASILILVISSASWGVVFYAAANPSPTSSGYGEAGIYPGAPAYTVWKEDSTYYAKDANGHIPTWGIGTNATAIIESANDALTSGGTIYVKDFLVPTNIAIVLSTNVHILEYYQGRLREYTSEGLEMQPFKTFSPSMRVVSTSNVSTTMPHITSPRAIHYVNAYNRIYFTWLKGSPDWDIYVKYYDWETGNYSAEVKVTDSPISDDHGAPAIIIDDDGYIHIFYDAWHTDLRYRRSTNPEDITSWTSSSVIANYATYINARIVTVNNVRTIYVFYRSGTAVHCLLENFNLT